MAKISLPRKTLIVTTDFPPAPGGSSVVFKNLLQHIDPASFAVLTKSWNHEEAIEPPEGYCVFRIPDIIPFAIPGRRHIDPLFRKLAVRKIVKAGLKAVEDLKCDGVLAAFPHHAHLEAGAVVARKAGVPFSVYLHDTVLEANLGVPLYERWAKSLQKRIFKMADPIFVMTGGMQELYQREYGMETIVLPHCFDKALPAEELPRKNNPNEINLFFGGSIYRTCLSAFQNILNAIRPDPRIRVSISNPGRPHPDLHLPDNRLNWTYMPDESAFLHKLRQSDVLLVPLGFTDNVAHGEISTIFPTKCIEYLWAGRPILVHCPEDYYLAKFFKKHQCGLVVSDPAPDAIRRAVIRLVEDTDFVNTMVQKARRALMLFSGAKVAETLCDSLRSCSVYSSHQMRV